LDKSKSTSRKSDSSGAVSAAVVIRDAIDAIVVIDAHGTIRDWNPQAEAVFGWRADEILGHAAVDIILPPRLREAYLRALARQLETGESLVGGKTLDLFGQHRDGHEFPLQMTIWRSGASGAAIFVAMVRNASEMRQPPVVLDPQLHAEAAPVESRLDHAQDYQLLFKSHPEPMWVNDVDTLGFLEVNDAALHKYGYSRDEFLAMVLRDICPPEDLASLPEHADLGMALDRPGPSRHLKKDGTRIDVEITSQSIRLGDRSARLVMAQDVTQRRRMARHSELAERLDSIAKLAGGVAHDFNNLLSVIINYAGFVRGAVPVGRGGPQEDIWRSVDDDAHQIERAAARAAALTQQLLAFARRQPAQPEVLNVNDVVRQVAQLLRHTLDENIELVISVVDEPRPVVIDPGRLEQVLINLADNARDAMPDGGTLTLITENFDVDEASLSTMPGLNAGPHLRIAVRDTGSGMTDDVMGKAFEPFFTTKKSGEGTGLGLATVYGSVVQAGGEVYIDSKPEGGTSFFVLLPAHSAVSSEPEPT
jgi:PAS domain S-box-containing protein